MWVFHYITLYGVNFVPVKLLASPCDGNVTSHKCNIDLGLMWVWQ